MIVCRRTLLTLLLSLALYGQAQATMPSFCAGEAECARHYSTAVDLSGRGELALAITAYKAAYDRKSFPPLLYNIARLCHRAGNLPEAASYYQRYLDAPPDEYPAQRIAARTYLSQVTDQLEATRSPQVSEAKPAASVAVTHSPPKEPGKPIYKRWWLWTAVGGVVVAGVVIGATLGAYARPPDWEDPLRFRADVVNGSTP